MHPSATLHACLKQHARLEMSQHACRACVPPEPVAVVWPPLLPLPTVPVARRRQRSTPITALPLARAAAPAIVTPLVPLPIPGVAPVLPGVPRRAIAAEAAPPPPTVPATVAAATALPPPVPAPAAASAAVAVVAARPAARAVAATATAATAAAAAAATAAAIKLALTPAAAPAPRPAALAALRAACFAGWSCRAPRGWAQCRLGFCWF